MDFIEYQNKILDKDFFMNMLWKYADAPPPFRSYWEHLFQKKRMVVVALESGAMVLQFAKLRKELLLPCDQIVSCRNPEKSSDFFFFQTFREEL